MTLKLPHGTGKRRRYAAARTRQRPFELAAQHRRFRCFRRRPSKNFRHHWTQTHCLHPYARKWSKKMGGNMLNRRTRARGNKQRRGTRRLQAAVRHNRSSESAQNHSQTQETDAFVTVVPLKWPQTRACFAGSDISMVLENGERIFGLIKFRTIFPPVYSSDFVPRGLPSLCVPLRLFPVPNEGVSCARVCLVAAVMLWPLPLRGVRDTRRFTTPAGRESPAPVAAQRTGALPRPCVRRPLPRGEF